MTEHVHEWAIDHQIVDPDGPLPIGQVFAYCGCGEELRENDIFRRVNATEKLSADNARMAADFIHTEEGYKWEKETEERERTWNLHEEFDALQAYASALEGK
jgi:hypothetical protein